jgi:hypothetical protein
MRLRLPALGTTIIALLVAPSAVLARSATVGFVVDGVHLSVPRAAAHGIVLSGRPGDATQETTIVDRALERTVSVIAVPYGTKPGIEDALPVARRDGALTYRNALHDFRVRNGQFASIAPPIDIFGTRDAGEVSIRHEDVPGMRGTSRDVLTAEWVAEAGSRIWIVRVVQFVGSGRSFEAVPVFVASLGGLEVTATSSLSVPTTILSDAVGSRLSSPQPIDVAPSPARTGSSPDSQLPQTKPPNYSDSCDVANYDRATGEPLGYWRNYLGTSYRGVPACGPRPIYGGIDVSAIFYNGAPWGVLEWECVELSLRWMYLAYGTPPYPGNGDQLYYNYHANSGGQKLYQIANSPGPPYIPHGGDVLSYETGGSGGHTSVVRASYADANGNGWVNVIEENASYHGFSHLTLTNYQVLSNYGGYIIGYLTPYPH